MPVKHWSFAGLILTEWCNARCASCYLCCSPEQKGQMGLEEALGYWRGLLAASPHGCRIHLTGGEPFGNWPLLAELCRRAAAEKLSPLAKVETNAFWADSEGVVRDRLRQLDESGMVKLAISADPYHQQFVPIERCRLLARLAEEILGPGRVQVRWRRWLEEGFDTDRLAESRRAELFARHAAGGKDRLTGRAAEALAGELSRMSLPDLADNRCSEAVLRSRHVHVTPGGWIMPGVCAGIALGQAGATSVAEVWRALAEDHDRRPVVGTLARRGPIGLLELAASAEFRPQTAYAGKCHLCWQVRKHLAGGGSYPWELGPAWVYRESVAGGGDRPAGP